MTDPTEDMRVILRELIPISITLLARRGGPSTDELMYVYRLSLPAFSTAGDRLISMAVAAIRTLPLESAIKYLSDLAWTTAILASLPGGITVAGIHYETTGGHDQ